jgi:uncharacterized protein YdhG (YjbR/CyaY superfamily)
MPKATDPQPGAVDAYIARQPAAFAAALDDLRARLRQMLPGHIECLSYAMPGFRQPHKGGKMVIGYAAFAKHIGLYPHSGQIMAQIDAAPYKVSKSGLTFAPHCPPPDALLRAILSARLAELGAPFPAI